MSTIKKKCAVFTIVKNENYFLPIWLKHYKKYFDNSDIYVLNHQSDDGSTDNLDVNVELIVNELAFDHQWLVDTVQNFQVKLLEKYDSVLFAESDELVYTLEKPLNEVIDEFLLDGSVLVQTCTAKEVMENLGVEKELELGDEIFQHRHQWYDNPIYHKTLLSKVPLLWVWGFHFIKNGEPNKKYNLQMAHLHRCDFNLMLKRHQERATKWNLKDDGAGVGFQHRIGDRVGVLKYFNNIEGKIEIIPQEHKDALNGI